MDKMRKGEDPCVKGRGRKEKGSWKNEKKKEEKVGEICSTQILKGEKATI